MTLGTLLEADKFVEVSGVRVIPKSTINNTLITYDSIERTDGSGRSRKGTPKAYEIEQHSDDYGIDIEYMKKSDFPISYDFKTKTTTKIKMLGEIYNSSYDLDKFSQKGIPRGYVYVHFWNDNQSFLIHKDDVDKLEELDIKEFNAIDKVVS